MGLRIFLATIFALFAAASVAAAAAEAQQATSNPRVALVIGNATYRNAALATTANDAGLVEQTLQAAGFDVAGARDLDGQSLRLAFRELRQDANTRDLIFDVPSIIATISADITLVSVGVIATGTPAGAGIGFKPPRYLVPGDVVRLEISGIGVLENEVQEWRA
jgi:2-keto-4-pentenoate hydratase/2-oxohepta-3-ene-1,7-dioic acid hydratase in catechol pathway